MTLSFVEGYKWRFTEGAGRFTASFEDAEFRERMAAREEGFLDGDRLRVRMRVVQKEVDGNLKVERTILKVLDHQPRKQYPQAQIDYEADSD